MSQNNEITTLEASELGWAVGYVPSRLSYNGEVFLFAGNVYNTHDDDPIGWAYFSCTSDTEVHVLND